MGWVCEAGPYSGIQRSLPEEGMFFGFNEAVPSLQEGGVEHGKGSGHQGNRFA